MLGSIPFSLGGIKVYTDNTSRDEVILDCDIAYAGDARVVFTLQVNFFLLNGSDLRNKKGEKDSFKNN